MRFRTCSTATQANDEVQNVHAMGVRIFYAKGTYPLFWASSGTASEGITIRCIPQIIYYCALYRIQGVLRGKIDNRYFGKCYYATVRKRIPYDRVKVCMVRETELFECPDLNPLDFVCVVGCRAKFQNKTRVYETNCWLEFWMLLPAKNNVKINSDEKHAFFAHELQSALRLTVGFREHLF